MIRNSAFVMREVYGQSLLMPVRRNSVGDSPILLNGTATAIWKQAEHCASSEELVQAVADLFDVALGSAEHAAVTQFVAQLVRMTLIQPGTDE